MNNGDLVIYVPKDSNGNIYKCEIGKIKRIDGDSAFVYFYSGETTSKTNLSDLIKIDNQSYIQLTMLGKNITEKALIAGYYEEDKSYVVELHKDKINEILKEIFNANEIKYL
jgi:hypothetical protein